MYILRETRAQMPVTFIWDQSRHKYQVHFTWDQVRNARYVLHEIRAQIPGMLHMTSDQRECASFLRYQNTDKTSGTLFTKADHYLMSGTICSQSEQTYQVRFVRNQSRYIRYALFEIRADMSGTLCTWSELRVRAGLRFVPEDSTRVTWADTYFRKNKHWQNALYEEHSESVETWRTFYTWLCKMSSPFHFHSDQTAMELNDYSLCTFTSMGLPKYECREMIYYNFIQGLFFTWHLLLLPVWWLFLWRDTLIFTLSLPGIWWLKFCHGIFRT